MTRVVQLLRYPLKSAAGERVDAVDVEAAGLPGDRAWACVDVADGTLGSAKHPGRWGRLLAVSAAHTDDGCRLTVAGRQVVAGTEQADEALSQHLGRPVRLTQDLPADPRLHRQLPAEAGLLPAWMADQLPGGELVTSVTGARAGRFVDFGALHLVTTGALVGLAGQLGRPVVDPMRFRPNLELDLPRDPAPGERLRLGEVVLQVRMPTPRCAVPGLAAPSSELDRPLLAELARGYRRDVGELGRAACFGVYADVVEPGRLSVG